MKGNLDRRRGGRRKTPVVLQMERTECGAACLAMILAYHGRWVSLEELRVTCGVSRDGSKATGVLRAARVYGLSAEGYRRDPGRLFDLPFPMIIFWRFNHYLVLEGVRGKNVFVVDPAEGPRTLPMEEFDKGFTGICLAFAPDSKFRTAGRRPSLLPSLLARLATAKSAVAFTILATVLLLVPGLAIPTLSKVFVDDVLVPRSDSLLVPLLIGLAVAAAGQCALTWMQQNCLARLETKLSIVMATGFLWHVLSLPMSFFNQRFAGDISERVTLNDRVARLLSGEFGTSAVNMLAMTVYGAVMLSYDIILSLVAFSIVGLNLLVVRGFSNARQNAARWMLTEQGKIAGLAVSGVNMIETLKANCLEGTFFSRWSGIHARALTAQQRLDTLSHLLTVTIPLSSNLATVAILAVGGVRLLDGAITIGGLVAFQALYRSFAQPAEGIVRFGVNLQTAVADLARIDDVLKHRPDERRTGARGVSTSARPAPRHRAGPISRAGLIAFENVTFGYNSHEPPLITGFNLSLNGGQRTAVVGGSGSGKSTIARLACGLLKPWEGEIRIGGVPIEEIPPRHIPGLISYIDQNIFLFEGSVHDNVTLWNPAIMISDVNRALRDAMLYDEIMARSGDDRLYVQENGRNFSGGQRQRLEIARALATNPSILVMDEATSALDPEVEFLIDSRIRERSCTCLIVAHRLSTIRDAEEIVVLDGGKIVQHGRHNELSHRDGVYRTLLTSG